MIKLATALEAIYKDCSVAVENEKIFLWKDERPRPSEEQIQAKIAELEAAEPMRLLRIERNQKLAETDWMANSDVVMTDKWKTYRQALRDLPATAEPQLDENGMLTNITWPEVPE